MSIPINFNYSGVQRQLHLESTNSHSDKTILIDGRNYKILGSEEDISLLKSHINSLDTTNIESFKACLLVLGSKEKKAGSVFQKSVVSSTAKEEVALKLDSTPLVSWSKQEKQQKRKIGELYWEKNVVNNSDNTHEGLINYLRYNAKYDPIIDNHEDRLVQKFFEAIKTPGKEGKEDFLKIFESIPMGILYTINQGEKLDAFPPSPSRNPNKTTFTQNDLAELQQFMKDMQFSGVVCLSDSKGGEPCVLSSGDNLNVDTPFAMHSIGKMFTGILTIKMIEQNIIPKESLDKPIQLNPEVWKNWPKELEIIKDHLTKEGAPTFRQIMLHKGGLGDYLRGYEKAIQHAIDNNEQIPKIHSPDDFIKYAENEIYELKEGETHYSNLGILLIGLSIQHHYNSKNPTDTKSYQEILQKFVVDQAGLSSFSSNRPEDGCYNEYHTAASHIEGGPAGGYWIKPMDLLKFGEWVATQCKDTTDKDTAFGIDQKGQTIDTNLAKANSEKNSDLSRDSTLEKKTTFYELVKEYGGEFTEEPGELSHEGAIDSASSFLGSFLPNGICVSILSNRPFQAEILKDSIKNHILSKVTD